MNRVLPPQQRFEAYYCMRVQSHDGLEPRAKGAGFDGSTQIALDAVLAFEPVIEFGIKETEFVPAAALCRIKREVRPQQHLRQLWFLRNVDADRSADAHRIQRRIRIRDGRDH